MPVTKIVVLILENRSFDHLVGFLRSPTYKIDGLTGNETNPQDCAVPNSPLVHVTRNAGYTTYPDPGHELPDVNVQLFCADPPATGATARNLGFVRSYSAQPNSGPAKGATIMDCFDVGKLPVVDQLAKEFSLCDRWFSSVPGPTWPNRFFAHAATSDGVVQMGLPFYVRPYPMRSIYENLEAAKVSWRIYYHDIPQSLALNHLRQEPYLKHFRNYSHFAADVAAGDLPSYTFIEPAYFDFLVWKANDQHPSHDMRLGEELIAHTYETVRGGASWPETLLIVSYDEHGGFYDHVPPPTGVPNPDGKSSTNPGFQFDFTRLGLRVPTLLISPLVPPGSIDSTQYEHCSTLATVKGLFNLPSFLTKRDAWAQPIAMSQWLATPRATPARVGPAKIAPSTIAAAGAQPGDADAVALAMDAGMLAGRKPTELQESLVALANTLEPHPTSIALDAARRLPTEHDAAVHVRGAVERFFVNAGVE